MAGRMIAASPQFLSALRQHHNLELRAALYPADGSAAIDLDVGGGQVTVDRTAAIRRTLELVLPNPLLYPTRSTDPLQVTGAEVRVWRGLRFAGSDVALIPQGVFRVDTLGRSTPASPIKLTGSDRSAQVADERFEHPRVFPAMQALALLEQLITEVYPDAAFDVQTTDTTVIPKHAVDRDRWPECQRIAALIGCEVYPTELGVWRIAPVPVLDPTASVWTVDTGETGVMVSADDTISRVGAPNIVVVTSDGSEGGQTYRGVARDTDPLSPTYYLGPYGAVPRFVTDSLITSNAQAAAMAAAELANHLGATKSVDFKAVPNPALDAGDVITVAYPDGVAEQHLLDGVVIPLDASSVQTSATRAADWNAE